jgi:hypothetical protein
MRHCEPPENKWLELLNNDKGARQPAFIILPWLQAKDKLRIASLRSQ